MKEGSWHISDFLELRSMVGRYETEIASLQQTRLDTPSPTTLSRGRAKDSRVPVPVYSGNHSTLSIFFQDFSNVDYGAWRGKRLTW